MCSWLICLISLKNKKNCRERGKADTISLVTVRLKSRALSIFVDYLLSGKLITLIEGPYAIMFGVLHSVEAFLSSDFQPS